MKFVYILLFIIISSCTTNKVVSKHGTNFLEKKNKNLVISQSNQNDILKELGPPSSKSLFDENIWIYIERKKSSRSIFTLGNRKLVKNNVLILEINNGILKKKNFFNLDKMNKLNFDESMTAKGYDKNSYVYNLLTSLRQKINAPITRKQREKKKSN